MREEEPLDAWAARHERNRRPVGTRRAVIIGRPDTTPSHLFPKEPRAIEEWDGYQWVAVTLIEGYAPACRFLDPEKRAEQFEREAAAEIAAARTRSFPSESPGRHRESDPEAQP